jgi:tetratricopeptide (TPR) repeat protein
MLTAPDVSPQRNETLNFSVTASDPTVRAARAALGRNQPCSCGSGNKYKFCCGRIGVASPSSPGSATRDELQQLALLLRSGQTALLEPKLRALLAEQPGRGELWHLLGLTQRQQGVPCLEALSQAVRLLPEDPESAVNLGNELARLKRHAEAIASYERALVLRPDMADAHLNLGEALLATGLAARAREHYCRTLKHQPHNLQALYGLARSDAALGDLNSAERGYRKVLALNDSWAEAHNSLGNVLRSQARVDEALAAYRRALAVNPNLAEVHGNFAIALRLDGQVSAAQESCRRALELDPGLIAALITWAETQADQGQFDAAEALYRQVLALAPESPEAWAGLGRLRRMTRADARWFEAVQRLAAKPLPPRQESLLRYAMGKYLDEVGDYVLAFENFGRANALDRMLHARYDAQAAHNRVTEIIRSGNAVAASMRSAAAESSARAVLIIGMPRSGTSLGEQILASHPQVFGAGELMYWSEAAAQGSGPNASRDFAADYLQKLGQGAGSALRVIDKMPANFLHLGLIHAALPRARIIHLQRDPVDTCLSIYFQHFEGFHSYANDLEDLAHYYREYWRLMTHWRASLPEKVMLEVPYAALVQDPEHWSRRMIEFIELPWDPRCLEFHRHQRTVLTASHWQVRQPITGLSLERWRHYQNFLGPLESLWRDCKGSA